MKLNEIIKVVAKELGSSDLKEINKLFKSETTVKFRITGKAVGHFGLTGHIKSISEDGIKVYMTNKVSLIRLEDIEGFEKAKPRVERPKGPKPEKEKVAKPVKAAKPKKVSHQDFDDEDDEDEDFEEGFDVDFETGFDEDDTFEEKLVAKKQKKGKAKPLGKSGSRFIPTSKK